MKTSFAVDTKVARAVFETEVVHSIKFNIKFCLLNRMLLFSLGLTLIFIP